MRKKGPSKRATGKRGTRKQEQIGKGETGEGDI